MKRVKIITGIALMTILGFTSCQSEINDVQGENPNTNAPNSTTARNLKRTSMYDGSFDDFIDGTSCSSILLPAKVTVNGVQVSLLTQADYQQVLSILGQFNNDQDSVVLQFPLRVRMSDYTEVSVANQTEYNAIVNKCSSAETSGQDAISSLKINFPITILTYNLNLQQTGSVVITSEHQLYTYMNAMNSEELFSIKYPMSVTLIDGTKTTVSSDAEFQSSIKASLETKATMTEAQQNSKKLETILVNGKFKVATFLNAGVDSASNYSGYAIDFANNYKIEAVNNLNAMVNGTYSVTSELNVFLKLNFTGNTTFSLLNNNWKIKSFNASTIYLQSSTNAAVTLVLKQI